MRSFFTKNKANKIKKHIWKHPQTAHLYLIHQHTFDNTNATRLITPMQHIWLHQGKMFDYSNNLTTVQLMDRHIFIVKKLTIA